MCPSRKHIWRGERKVREGVFHGSFDQKERCDDYSGVGVAGRVVRLDYAYGDDAIIPTFTHRLAQQSCHSLVLPAAAALLLMHQQGRDVRAPVFLLRGQEMNARAFVGVDMV